MLSSDEARKGAPPIVLRIWVIAVGALLLVPLNVGRRYNAERDPLVAIAKRELLIGGSHGISFATWLCISRPVRLSEILGRSGSVVTCDFQFVTLHHLENLLRQDLVWTPEINKVSFPKIYGCSTRRSV